MVENESEYPEPKIIGKFKSGRLEGPSELRNSTLDSSDVYVEVKTIPIPKEKFTRKGENGLNVPKKYFPTSVSEFTPEEVSVLFRSCDSFTFNMSNRDGSKPVTCVASFDSGNSIFINLHQLRTHRYEDDSQKLCEDRSTITFGNNSTNFGDEAVMELISLTLGLFKVQTSQELYNFFNPAVVKETTLFEKIYYWFTSMVTSSASKPYFYREENSYAMEYYLRKKKINTLNVYP